MNPLKTESEYLAAIQAAIDGGFLATAVALFTLFKTDYPDAR